MYFADNAQLIIIAILTMTMAMFLWGRWRHDMVAMAALLACVFLGLIPGASAFSGFGHPAVITVASVLILGQGLQSSGAVNILAHKVLPTSAGTTTSILALISLAAFLSCFMNNVGALALLMPIAIQMATEQKLPPGKILMPLAFGSILGGMTTLIGTPPNLIVSSYRTATGAGSFGMFDFTPVGASVASIGVLFVGLVGWRLVPIRKTAVTGSFETGSYLSEVRIIEGSKAVDKNLREVEAMLDEADAQVIGMAREAMWIAAPNPARKLKVGDILIIQVEPESLSRALTNLGLKLEEDVAANTGRKEAYPSDEDIGELANDDSDEQKRDKVKWEEVEVQELVVTPNAPLVSRSAADIGLRSRFGINLLAISRRGRHSIRRLRSTPIQAGDVLLMQGAGDALVGFASQYGCLPLATRDIRVPQKRQALTASLIMFMAMSVAAFGLLPAAVSFAAGALAFVVLGIVPVRAIYSAVDWPVIVLLAAMLPVADAMASTGTADLIAHVLLDNLVQEHLTFGLIGLLIITMFLSDIMNNAATAAVMCPIAISVAGQLGVNADTFLMAIAIGSSCAFLTPIGHQNNTLILGPGGFHFGDFWKLGLVLEAIVVTVSVPMLLWVWPL